MNKEFPSDAEFLSAIDTAIRDFHGNSSELQSAIGALLVGRHVGWRVVLLIHHRTTIRKYEKILGLKFREVLPETGPKSNDSLAWRAAQKVGSFWKAVKGEIPGIKSPTLD